MEFLRKKKDLSKYDSCKLGFDNLEIILTQKCNLACEHCMRGNCTNKEISEEVLDSLLSKTLYIENLALGGGEITLVPEKIKLLTRKLKEHKTIVHHANFTSNGILVSDDIIEALTELRDYILSCKEEMNLFEPEKDEIYTPLYICFSFDDFHLNQIINKGITIETLFENIATYQKHFGDDSIQCRMECDIDFYNEGRAKNLPASAQKISMQKVLTTPYPILKSNNLDFILIGNVPCVSCDGNIIPTNVSFESEKALSFGNILTDPISQILSNMNVLISNEKQFNKTQVKIFKTMTAPKKLQKKYKPYLNEKEHIFFTNIEIMSQRMH
jgi:organic radical activating enzyme